MIEKRFFCSSTEATLGEDGFWTVITDMQEGVKVEDSEWISRAISAKSIDKDMERAYQTASRSLQAKFKDLDGELLSLPKDKDGYRIQNPLQGNQASTELSSDS